MSSRKDKVEVISDIGCDCGRIIKYIPGITRVTCVCGRTYVLHKDGRPVNMTNSTLYFKEVTNENQ